MTAQHKNEEPGELTGQELERYIILLRDGDNFEKEKAIDALIASPGREVIERIVPLLQESVTPVRMAVLDVLKKIGSVHLECIIGMLDDENEDIRVYACEVLSFLSDPRSIPYIAKKARDDVDNVRNAACMVLGDFDDDVAVNALLGALDDEEWIAFSAIISLGRTKSPRAIPRILQFFKDSEDELSSAACEVLLDYGDNTVLDEMIEVLKGWDTEKRGAYLKIILEKANEEIFGRLKEKIGDELYEHLLGNIDENRHRPVEMVSMLTQFRTLETCNAVLNILTGIEPDNDNYETILEHFASLGDVWSGDVARLMTDNEGNFFPLIKACAMTGTRIDEKMLLEHFLNAPMEVKREIVMNIRAIADGTGCPIIREALDDADGHIRGFAVEAVGNLGLRDLKDDILRIVRNDFHDVRVKALKSLIRLEADQAMDLIAEFVDKGSADDKKVYLASTGLIDSESNLPFITRLLADEDESVRRSTIGVLGNFVDNEKYLKLVERSLDAQDVPHEVLKVIKDRKLIRFKDRLTEIFKNTTKSMWTRYYALSALGTFRDPGLYDILVKGLQDQSDLITIGCIRALADLNDGRARSHIQPFAASANDDIRSAAEMVLSRMQIS
jgi:HEAT repeat protein